MEEFHILLSAGCCREHYFKGPRWNPPSFYVLISYLEVDENLINSLIDIQYFQNRQNAIVHLKSNLNAGKFHLRIIVRSKNTFWRRNSSCV